VFSIIFVRICITNYNSLKGNNRVKDLLDGSNDTITYLMGGGASVVPSGDVSRPHRTATEDGAETRREDDGTAVSKQRYAWFMTLKRVSVVVVNSNCSASALNDNNLSKSMTALNRIIISPSACFAARSSRVESRRSMPV